MLKIVVLVGSVFIWVGMLLTAEPQPRESSGMIEFKAIKTAGKEFVEVNFSDVRFVASELSFVHENGSRTRVMARNGSVEVQTGGLISSGKNTKIKYPNGLLSLQGLTE